MTHILIVDDEQDIREICKTYFEYEGYHVSTASNGKETLDLLNTNVDVMVIDIMMPEMNGYEVVREMKNQGLDIPYVYLTAKTSEQDTIFGLMLGADDYVKKPFSPRELVIRVKNLMNRVNVTSPSIQETIHCGRLVLNNLNKTVELEGEVIPFRIKEFELLWYFANHESVALSKTDLLEQVWGYEYYEDMNTLNVHVHRIREKLEKYGYDDYIIATVWGLGYKFQRQL
ncbi:response regulator transcription factor [Staphylococcus pseudintermedius]|uniref:response regulator transcription factor n=1 Tax=Staphylococcus pseudintermedius TaxID=283734 RepID=UPI00165663E7|nr:response regulator transcription factor [Staphylococcus pseudintermedius]EGQ3448612.1 response regulator transcription factor [Staphylococcus pseudintermedius]EIM5198902.1 response regulator transcription factor [Staphylococcus pseudintermedius]EIT0465625.1 response regulator transcription factor [Staphylococcus pseudintermedius]EJM2460751.1 response regulator transcription factor [Staphylococcus pseudintermedius]EJO7137748.1 response regulator transcription factor [Staphylococcus pseudinte